MRAFVAFTGKEFIELLRTYKLLILVVVFLFFGMLSPVTAKHLPEILKMAGLDPASLGISNPTAADSFAQFFKNIGQMGLLVLVVIYCGIMANEFSKGTLINMLTKGLKRRTVIISKVASSVVAWTFAYLLSAGVSYGFTSYYFDMKGLHHTFFALTALWLYGVFLLMAVIFGGVLFKTVYGSLLFTGGVAVALTLLNLVPTIQKYNPASLATDNLAVMTAQKGLDDLLPAFILCVAAILAFIIGSVVVFDKKQI